MVYVNAATSTPPATYPTTRPIMIFSLGHGPLGRQYAEQRQQMVHQQIVGRGITDPRVVNALLTVPRHRFVPADYANRSYADEPLPLGQGQTISQPYIVAFMTDAASIPANGRVLEVGTGSGYQTAILAELAQEVYSIEILTALAQRAEQTLSQLGYQNVHLKRGNGYEGWADHAPYDAIVVTAAPPRIPSALVDQLAMGGKLVVPVGHSSQTLLVITRHLTGLSTEYTIPVRFVPMVDEPVATA